LNLRVADFEPKPHSLSISSLGEKSNPNFSNFILASAHLLTYDASTSHSKCLCMSDSQTHAAVPDEPTTWTEPPWSGWIETTGDALLILEAARRGLIPRVTRRLVESERKMITSGSVFVFDEDESGIKRWTDGFFWSPSRILGNFLLYRETEKRGASLRGSKSTDNAGDGNDNGLEGIRGEGTSLSRPKGEPTGFGIDRARERVLVGSLTNSYKFKTGGMVKKVSTSGQLTSNFI
jgi:Gti1/Pac2 family transcription factor